MTTPAITRVTYYQHPLHDGVLYRSVEAALAGYDEMIREKARVAQRVIDFEKHMKRHAEMQREGEELAARFNAV